MKGRLGNSTSLTPIAGIVADFTNSADLIFQPIDDALTEALAEANSSES